MQRRDWIFAGVLAVLLAARLVTAYQYSVPAVDGRQYLALADELRLRHRFAFSQREAPTYSRLPGYPLFLSVIASGTTNPVRRACLANVFCDLTAALALGWLARRRFGDRAAAALVVVVLTCPLLVILASHALTETSATMLGVLELVIAFIAAASGSVALAAAAGLFAGLGQLWRADAMTVVPAALLALLLGQHALRRRLWQAAIFLAVAIAVFAPWPIRNLVVLGRTYPFAWQWRTAQGHPLPTGIVRWARTWTRCDPSEYSLDPLLAFEQPLPSPLPIPWATSDAAEREQLTQTLDRYNRERLSPTVDAEFETLADQRWVKHPFAILLLPLQRLPAMLRSVPSGELSISAPLLGLVERRPWVRYYDFAIYLLALVGLARLWRSDRRVMLPLLILFALRLLLLSATVPLGLSQRHLVEVVPWILFCAMCAFAKRREREVEPFRV